MGCAWNSHGHCLGYLCSVGNWCAHVAQFLFPRAERTLVLYKLHFYLNILNILLTIIGFILAVVATQKESDEHFTEETHQKAGLAVFIIVLFQALAGYFRPSPPKKDTNNQDDGDETEATNGNEVEQAVQLEETSKPAGPTKTVARIAWEISHRLIGLALLGLAWYNCTSGIELQEEKYDETVDWSAIFWGVTGGISGVIFVAHVSLKAVKG